MSELPAKSDGPWSTLSGNDLFDRIEQAAARIHARLLLAAQALDIAGIPYAVCGDWGSRFHVVLQNQGGERNCVDIEIIVRRDALQRAGESLVAAGLVCDTSDERYLFRPIPEDLPRNPVELFIAGERIRANQLLPTPDPNESESGSEFRVLALGSFVRFALSRFRTLDRVHIRDLLEAHAIDQGWLARLPQPLSDRLKEIIDDPRG